MFDHRWTRTFDELLLFARGAQTAAAREAAALRETAEVRQRAAQAAQDAADQQIRELGARVVDQARRTVELQARLATARKTAAALRRRLKERATAHEAACEVLRGEVLTLRARVALRGHQRDRARQERDGLAARLRAAQAATPEGGEVW